MIEIAAPQPQRAEELYDLAAKVFGHGYFEFLRCCRGGYFGGSTYDWSVSRVAEDDGRMVAHVGVWDHQMRVGRARLRSGGVGAVMTHPHYRKRGIALKLFAAIRPAMRDAGYHFTLLFGIRGFYHRFGYVPAWPTSYHVVRTDGLPNTPLRLRLRKVRATEPLCGTGAIMRIYNRENAERTGSAERPIYTLAGGLNRGFECRSLCDSAGRTRGYVVTKKDRGELHVLEVGGLGAACGVGQLLAAIRLLARRAGCWRIRVIRTAYDHPLCRTLRAGDCDVEMHHVRSGGAMASVISLRGCLEQMAGELSRRLRGSSMRHFKGSLSVSGAEETVTLEIAGGKVRVRPKPAKTRNRIVAGHAAASLLIGSAEPATLAVQSGVRFSGAAGELAETLFPNQWPMLGQLDQF